MSIEKEEIGDIEEAIERLSSLHAVESQIERLATPIPPPAAPNSNAAYDAQLAQEALDVGQALAGQGEGAAGSIPPGASSSGINLPGLCPDGYFYDPVHQICQPYPVANPPSGYEQVCPDGYAYDPVHQVCTPYMTVQPPAFFPR